MTTKLIQLTNSYNNLTATNEDIARQVLEDIINEEIYDELIVPLTMWVSSHRRLSQITIERDSDVNSSKISSGKLKLDHDDATKWKARMDVMVCIRPSNKKDPGLWKSWSEMTVEDHNERILYQEKRIDGIRADQELHRTAIYMITKAGVTCLGEIPIEES